MPDKMTWDGTANQQLLCGIILLHDFKLDYAAIAKFMGDQCTPNAIQHQIKKIKKLTPEEARSNGTAAATPAKNPKVSKATSTKANGNKAAQNPSSKKPRIKKANLLRTDSPEGEQENESNDGDLSNEAAAPNAKGKAKGRTDGTADSAKVLAKSILGAKRKAEDIGDEARDNVAVKKEKLSSDDEGEADQENAGDAQNDDAI